MITISLGLALAVMLVGLIYLCLNKAWSTIFAHMFLAGLIVVLLSFGGHFTAAIGH